jgi:hypothetical protein
MARDVQDLELQAQVRQLNHFPVAQAARQRRDSGIIGPQDRHGSRGEQGLDPADVVGMMVSQQNRG